MHFYSAQLELSRQKQQTAKYRCEVCIAEKENLALEAMILKEKEMSLPLQTESTEDTETASFQLLLQKMRDITEMYDKYQNSIIEQLKSTEVGKRVAQLESHLEVLNKGIIIRYSQML